MPVVHSIFLGFVSLVVLTVSATFFVEFCERDGGAQKVALALWAFMLLTGFVLAFMSGRVA